MAELNLRAGQRARGTSAYDAALGYLTIGLALLPEDGWAAQYDLTLALHTAAAESAFLTGAHEAMGRYIDGVVNHGTSMLDKVPAYDIQIQAHISQAEFEDGVDTALFVLSELGIDFPAQPTPSDAEAALAECWDAWKERDVPELCALPTIGRSPKCSPRCAS